VGVSYRRFLVVLIVSLAVPMAAVALLSMVDMKPTLLPLEKEVLGFRALPPPSMDNKDLVLSDLRDPLGQGQVKDYPPIALAEVAPPQGSATESGVSLIVTGRKTKLAVVQGAVLKEGDAFQGTKVARIQKDGVLLKNGKEEKWLMVK
jgi:hypothetical protein